MWVGKNKKNRPLVVTFTGGMGAQIISAAIYYMLKEEGRDVFADLSYFSKKAHRATEGIKGDCSHWPWQLDQLGITTDQFDVVSKEGYKKCSVLKDGPEKFKLGLDALRKDSVLQHFGEAPDISDLLPADFADRYLCIHIRRGDYVNVASHLVSDEEFVSVARQFSGLVDNLAVVSDSEIATPLKEMLQSGYKKTIFFDEIDAFSVHRIMRRAKILVCSNSQFSLVAALLNPDAFVLLPNKWFEDKGHLLESHIHKICRFQLLS